MSGLLALLDDVAAISRLAAAQLDDIATQAAKAGTKVAGVVIDDAAVTPKYVTDLPAARELPIIGKIAAASLFNKLVILLPVAMLLDNFAPWALPPLLMLGGAYLCFEGGEKIWHLISGHKDGVAAHEHDPAEQPVDKAHLEQQRVRGAIKTDFILSAEIMTITLSAIDAEGWMMRAAILAVTAIAITVLVYGVVALLVKMDDAGLKLSQIASTEFVRGIGRGIVNIMPKVMTVIATIGTTAMLWVGGNIIVHGAHQMGWHLPYETIKSLAKSIAGTQPFANWAATATMDGIVGVILGLILVGLLHAVKPANSH